MKYFVIKKKGFVLIEWIIIQCIYNYVQLLSIIVQLYISKDDSVFLYIG